MRIQMILTTKRFFERTRSPASTCALLVNSKQLLQHTSQPLISSPAQTQAKRLYICKGGTCDMSAAEPARRRSSRSCNAGRERVRFDTPSSFSAVCYAGGQTIYSCICGIGAPTLHQKEARELATQGCCSSSLADGRIDGSGWRHAVMKWVALGVAPCGNVASPRRMR
eukprot:TRINITY_DN3008_c0_g1_i1.p1 TRINITY_DN3008_c0_g1~~TRINITY_DN3008_c0_g1_i1.p1  ORF type:complete len:168 (-),score=9.57 TRINITY_DN3008_c0_g1_i1:111-614(-)